MPIKGYPSLIKKAITYFKANGFRKTLSRSLRRLSEYTEVPETPEDRKLELSGFYPPEALPIPIRKVANTSGRQRLSLVLPTVSEQQLYAGAWTALKIFWEAARKNGFRPRIICTTSPFSREGLRNLIFMQPADVDAIEYWQREDGVPCEVEEDEAFIVTAWWTAYVIGELERTNRIFYLVQDFEPGFYPWSYRYVLALESYKFGYARIFNTSILHEFFRGQQLLTGKDESFFEPGIDRQLFYPGETGGRGQGGEPAGKATLLLYGRPEVDRNLFELAILGLDRFLRENPAYRDRIGRIISVGEKHGPIDVGGFRIESLGKLSMTEWARLARESEIGISLMCSPHPSYPPLEMAAAGMVVVTNRIYNKDLSLICDNFIAADPNVEDLAAAITAAVDRMEDHESVRRSAEDFLARRDWDQNLEEISAFIGRLSGAPAAVENPAG